MKVLWFSNCVLSHEHSTGSGSWLFAMRDLISDEVDMVNVTEGNVKEVVCNKGNSINEYVLPVWPLKNGVPSSENVELINNIIEKEQPDIIHIWGTEKYWATLFNRGYINHKKVLIEIQGLLTACEDVFYGGLTPKECRNMISLKSILKPQTSQRKCYLDFHENSKRERELIRSFEYIATQSDWTRDQLLSICPSNTSFFQSLRPIRREFIEAAKWRPTGHSNPVVFCSFSYYNPFKGLHFLLKALKVLTHNYPNIILRIAGPNFMQKPFYGLTDYERLLKNLIIELDIYDNIQFCGKLNATELVEELQHADVAVNPSLVESYSAAAAESLYLGVPTVLAYAGAMVNFSSEKQVALYYNPLDFRSLSAKVVQLFENTDLRDKLIRNSHDIMNVKCDPASVKERQLVTYKHICEA